MSKNDFLERSLDVNNNGFESGDIWLSPNGLAYDAVGNEVDVGDLVKLLENGSGTLLSVSEIESDSGDPYNMNLSKMGWVNSCKVLKVGGPE